MRCAIARHLSLKENKFWLRWNIAGFVIVTYTYVRAFDLGNGVKFPISARGVHPPFTMGHEPVGCVVAVGPEANPDLLGRSL